MKGKSNKLEDYQDEESTYKEIELSHTNRLSAKEERGKPMDSQRSHASANETQRQLNDEAIGIASSIAEIGGKN